tara:strand:- start:1659 stop:2333 length:675 start_codon:yes stop_codon:yes gene_type:complete
MTSTENSNMKSYLPLFATNILMNYVVEDTDELIQASNHTDEEYSRSARQNGSDDDKELAREDNFRILEKYPRINDILLNKFKIAAKEFLGLTETDFIVSTSWLTKTEPGSESQYHAHKNSFYSGVYYYDEYTDKSGDIEFRSPLDSMQSYYIEPEAHHITNASSWKLPAQKNILLFFPSYLEHRVCLNESDKVRHSLAFNIIPYGFYGVGDSTVDTQWIMNDGK